MNHHHLHQTATERKRASRMKIQCNFRQQEQSSNTSRRKLRKPDSDYRQQEQTSNTSKRKSRRQDCEFRQRQQELPNTRRWVECRYYTTSEQIGVTKTWEARDPTKPVPIVRKKWCTLVHK